MDREDKKNDKQVKMYNKIKSLLWFATSGYFYTGLITLDFGNEWARVNF